GKKIRTPAPQRKKHGGGLIHGEMWAVEGRGRTTPPALNIANYLTIRALSYAVSTVYRPPACLGRRDALASGLLRAIWF
ncbi:MAG: hypothetical protein K2F99_07260, partial [Muribaculaceae bacterium]|nr:hypothetical protein [Muribaculaceae bacterium]